jgi:hypothetical protein
VKVVSWETRLDGGRRACAACGTAIGGYRYRFHPVGSPFFERCVGLAWCSGCRIYTATMVHVPRDEVLVDALKDLPSDQQERLRKSELKLVGYLARQGVGEE